MFHLVPVLGIVLVTITIYRLIDELLILIQILGQKFAMLEIKSIIVKILKNFEVSLSDGDDPILIAEIVLKSKNGINVMLKPRIYK